MRPEILIPVDCWSGFDGQSYNTASTLGVEVEDKHREGEGRGGEGRGGEGRGDHDHKNTTYEGGRGSDHDKSGKKGAKGHGESRDQDVNLPFFSFAPVSPLSQSLNAPALPPPTWDSDQKIFFNLDCTESTDFCNGMKQTLDLAGWYVSQVLPYSLDYANVDYLLSIVVTSECFIDGFLRTVQSM
jgi:hypothetical protein